MQTYLVELTLIWACCWALYYGFFRKEKFHRLNRFYLLGSYIAGLVIPLIEWPAEQVAVAPEWVAQPVVWLQTIPITAEEMGPTPEAGWLPIGLVYLVYAFGCGIMILRLLYQFSSLARKVAKGQRRWQQGICYVNHPEVQAPSSWLWFLFWNESTPLTNEESAAILAHERAHIHQRHSWDLLLLEITGIFLWWHPLWYAYRSSLVATHEFLADTAALRLLSKQSYGQLLLQQRLRGFSHAFAHTFNHHQLKNRIIMMTRQPSPSSALAKYLLIVPVMLLLFYACNEAERQVDEAAETLATQASFFERVDTVITFHPESYTESVEFVKTKIYEAVDQMPVFGSCGNATGQERTDCSNHNLLMHIYTNIKYPQEARTKGQEGTAVAQFVVNKDGSVSSAEILRDKTTEHESLNQETLRAIRELPDFQPGSHNGELVNVQIVLPIKFKLE